ncbi:MAG: hypothetical protein V4583_00200 [Pseudomonadota bacterium]
MRIAAILSPIFLCATWPCAVLALQADLNLVVSLPDEIVEAIDRKNSEIILLKLSGEKYVEAPKPQNELEIASGGQISLEWEDLSFPKYSSDWPDYLLLGAFRDESGEPIAFVPITPIVGDGTMTVDVELSASSRSSFITTDQFPFQPFSDAKLMERDLFPTTLQIFTLMLKHDLLKDGRESTRNRLYGLLIEVDDSILVAEDFDSASALVVLATLSNCDGCVTDVVEFRRRYITMLTEIIVKATEDREISDLGIGNLRAYAADELKRVAVIDPRQEITESVVLSLRKIFESRNLKLSPFCVDIASYYVGSLFYEVNNKKSRKFQNGDGRRLASIMADCGQHYALLLSDDVSFGDVAVGVSTLCEDVSGQRVIYALDQLNYMGLQPRNDSKDVVHKFVTARNLSESCDRPNIGGT